MPAYMFSSTFKILITDQLLVRIWNNLELSAPGAQLLRIEDGTIILENSSEVPQKIRHRIMMTKQPKRNEKIYPHQDLYMNFIATVFVM